MTAIATQLADALRGIERATVFPAPDGEDIGCIVLKAGCPEWKALTAALAAYDAQQAHTDEIVLPPEPPCDEQTAPNYGIIDDAYSFDALEAYARAAVELDRSRRA